jgi:acyl carrier protein
MWDNRFEEVLRDYLPHLPEEERLAQGSTLRDLGLDSIAMVELLSVLEGAYKVRLADEALSTATFETPETLWRAISEGVR